MQLFTVWTTDEGQSEEDELVYTVHQPHKGIMADEELVYTAHQYCHSTSTQLPSLTTDREDTVGNAKSVIRSSNEPLPVAGRGEIVPVLEVPLHIGKGMDYLTTILMDNGANLNLIDYVTAIEDLSNIITLSKPYPSRISTANGMVNTMAQQCTIRFKTPFGKYFECTFQTHPKLGYVKTTPHKVLPYFKDLHKQQVEFKKVNGTQHDRLRRLNLIVGIGDIHKFCRYAPIIYDCNFNPLGITSFTGSKGVWRYDTYWGTVWSGAFHSYLTYQLQKPNDLQSREPHYKKSELPFLQDHFKKSSIHTSKHSIDNEDSGIDSDGEDCHYTTEDLYILWKRFIDLDRLPIDKAEQTMTEEELNATKMIEKVMTLDPEKRRMTTRLLLKPHVRLQNNYFAVKTRMDTMYRNFNVKAKAFEARKTQYYEKFEEFIKLGVIDRVDDPQPHLNDDAIKYYAPVCVVEKLTSLTSPHRLCVEANFKTGTGLSLNDNILTTPSLHLKIADIELRSRMGKYLVIADIKKLFLNLKIDDLSDQNLLRVIYKPADANGPDDPYQVWRYNSVIWGIADSPFQLNTALHKCVNYWLQVKPRSDFEKEVAKVMVRSLYVDDLTMSWNEKQKAIDAIDMVNEIIAVGGFKFRKFLSNDSSILQHVPEQDRAPYDVVLQKSYDQELEKMISKDAVQLGYRYSSKTDEFLFDRFMNIASTRNVYTKRGVSSCLASVFDALKLIGPFILSAKRVLKEAFRYGLDWNEDIRQLPKHKKVIEDDKVDYILSILQLWDTWLQDLQQLQHLKFPRYIPNNTYSRYIIATDASKIGLCACCHVVTTENGCTTSHLVSSICNITPLAKDLQKPLSIPLLELKAIAYGHDLAKWLETEADVRHDQLLFISDSRVAIAWSLKPQERLLNHIGLVVKKLQARKYTIKYVPTAQNGAADLGSRACLYDGVSGDVWKHGPDWYKLPYKDYPFHSHEDTAEKYKINLGLKKKFSILDAGDSDKNAEYSQEELQFLASENNIFNITCNISDFFLEKNKGKIKGNMNMNAMLEDMLFSNKEAKNEQQKIDKEVGVCRTVEGPLKDPDSRTQRQRAEANIKAGTSEKEHSSTCEAKGAAFNDPELNRDSHMKHRIQSRKGKCKPDPLLRAVIKRIKTLDDAQDTVPKPLQIRLPILNYLGVTSWGYPKLIKHGALIFTAMDKFKEKNVLARRRQTHRELEKLRDEDKEFACLPSCTISQGKRSCTHGDWYTQTKKSKELTALQQYCKEHFPYVAEESRTHSFFLFVQCAQWRFFRDEMTTLHSRRSAEVKLRSTLAGLSPFLKRIKTGNIMCSIGRMKMGGARDDQLDELVRHPPIIDKRSKLAMLMAKHQHQKEFTHANAQTMANQLKRSVWIMYVKQLCRTIVKSCTKCQRTNARAHQQQMGNLPPPFIPIPLEDAENGKYPKPFEHTALDYTGYLQLKHSYNKKESKYKVYLAVFYCLYTKAFHIEIVQSTDTTALLMAFDRLCHVHGKVQNLYSDNQPSFEKGDKVIRERISEINKEIVDLQQKEKFDWKFGLPYKPQSMWEQPIKMVKQSLSRVLRHQIVDFQELQTLIARIQFTLNERPLQADKQTSADSFDFISPHRLIRGMSLAIPDIDFGKTTIPLSNVDQRKSLARLTTVLERFRNTYNNYYLINAQNRNHWRRKNQKINVHDLVMVRSFGTRKYEKRSRWNIGRIIRIHRSPRDQLVRRVDVKFPNQNIRTLSIIDIYPLLDQENKKEQKDMLDIDQIETDHDSNNCILCTSPLVKRESRHGNTSHTYASLEGV